MAEFEQSPSPSPSPAPAPPGVGPSAESPPPPAARPSRAETGRRERRPLAVAAAVVGIAVVAAVAVGGWWMWDAYRNRPAERVVVIGESMLEDGSTVAGVVAVVEVNDGAVKIESLDSAQEVALPGTSFDRLRDALSLGGPDEVARIVVGEEAAGTTAWIVLDEVVWAQVVDAGGGVEYAIPEDTTVFTGDRLFRFKKGSRRLSGEETVALVMGTDALESTGEAAKIRVAVGEAVANALADDPERARELLSGTGVEASQRPSALESFITQSR